jgi:hypothetical protein
VGNRAWLATAMDEARELPGAYGKRESAGGREIGLAGWKGRCGGVCLTATQLEGRRSMAED